MLSNRLLIALALSGTFAACLHLDAQDTGPGQWELGYKSTGKGDSFAAQYCGAADDTFVAEQVASSGCKDASDNPTNQWVLVRKNDRADRGNAFVMKMDCVTGAVGGGEVTQTYVPMFTPKSSCSNVYYPQKAKYTTEVDCTWDKTDGSSITTHGPRPLVAANMADAQEECAQLCRFFANNPNKRPKVGTCNSFVVNQNRLNSNKTHADYHTGGSFNCYTSSFSRMVFNPRVPQKAFAQTCGTTESGINARTPSPTPLRDCDLYLDRQSCTAAAVKCQWTDTTPWSTTTDKEPTCKPLDSKASCDGPQGLFAPIRSIMTVLPVLGPKLESLFCLIVGVVKFTVGALGSFKQNDGEVTFSQLLHDNEDTKDWTNQLEDEAAKAGLRMTQMELDHNDETMENFPTAFPEPKARPVKIHAKVNEDVDEFRARLKQEAQTRAR